MGLSIEIKPTKHFVDAIIFLHMRVFTNIFISWNEYRNEDQLLEPLPSYQKKDVSGKIRLLKKSVEGRLRILKRSEGKNRLLKKSRGNIRILGL